MTREDLINAINDNEDRWSCPSYNCDLPEEEGNSGDCCLKCAEKLLAEYERKVRADAIEECIEKLYEVTPNTVDEKLDMVFVNALRELKDGEKNE